MALYDWPTNQYKVPSEGLLYQNVNPYADSIGLMSGAYSPWDTPAVDFNYTGDPWFKGPEVTWSSPDTDYSAYMQKLADDEAAAIRNANNINNNNPYYGSGGDVDTGVSDSDSFIGKMVSKYGQNFVDLGYNMQNILGRAQGWTQEQIDRARNAAPTDQYAPGDSDTDADFGGGGFGEPGGAGGGGGYEV